MQCERQASRLRAKRVGLALAFGVVLLMGWALNKGVAALSPRFAILPYQQELPILTVCPSGPPVCQFGKIQEAINAAPEDVGPYYKPKAEIHVAPGLYEENLSIFKNVILKGAGKDRVFLRSPRRDYRSDTAIWVVSNPPGTLAHIEGFTIQGDIGVRLVGLFASAYIRNNRFESYEAAIFAEGAIVPGIIEGNTFARGVQSAIMAYHIGRLKVLNNTFEGPEIATINIEKARLNNPAGAPFRSPGERILIEGNQGGEIWIKDSAAIAVRKNTVGYIWLSKSEVTLIEENVVRRGSVTAALSGIMVEASSDVVIQKNIVEENEYGIRIEGDDAGIRRTAVAILSSRLVRNGWGIVTERLEYVTVCQNNEVMENQKGDYAVGSFSPQPSPELKQRCE